MAYDTDKYGVIINGAQTFAQAYADLAEYGTIVLNWGDQDGTLLNILLSFNPIREGHMGGLIDSGPSKLWVGIAGYGTYAFATGTSQDLVPTYIAEKFGMRGDNPTTRGLGVLLSEIRKGLF